LAKDRYRYFRIEARQLLHALSSGVLALESGVPTAEEIRGLLRAAHTLKGAARVVGLGELAEHAHALEDALSQLDAGEAPPAGWVDACLAELDPIQEAVQGLDDQQTASPPAAPAGQGAPGPGVAASEPEARDLRTVWVELSELDQLLEGLTEAARHVTRLARDGALLREAVGQLGVLARGSAAVSRPAVTELERLGRGMQESVHALERELGTLGEQAVEMRLVPADAVIQDLRRAVRDAAQATGKEAEFSSSGGTIRLDSHVLSKLRGALVHLVRNAVAHGLEDPGARQRAGKPATGAVEVTVRREGQLAVIGCRDDGRGLDPQAVRSAAVERGLLAPEAAAGFSLEQALRVLLRGGVSTSQQVDHVSGRGVGLDAVRAAVTELRGEVRVESEPGRGTRFELRVPVSLSSLPALTVRAGTVSAAFPLDAVRGVLRVAEDDVTWDAGHARLLYEGEAIPFSSLDALLGLPHATPGGQAVVVESTGGGIAVGVDRVQTVRRLLLRGLPAGVRAAPVVVGAAFEEAGAPCLVLSADAMHESLGERAPLLAPVVAAPAPRVLVIDDSLTTRMLERSILESAGYDVELATSAEEALEKAAREAYALFVVDVEMPGMNGFEFVRVTRADPQLRETPAILVTSLASREDKRRGQEVGASAYIVKSEFDQRALLRTIEGLVGPGRPA